MAEFTYRNVVQRKLEYTEVDDNLRHVQELHDETLAARDIAVSDSILYTSTVVGLAATAEGDYFVVTDVDELVYYRVESGVAVEKVRIGYRLPFLGGTLTQALNHATAVSIASAATVNIGAAASNLITITGTTTITAFDTIASGAIRVLTFAGALTLTHNATSLILPGGANILTAAGDVAVMLSLGGGNWRCIAYQRADGTAVDATLRSLAALGTAADRMAYTTGVDTWAEAPITAGGRALLQSVVALKTSDQLNIGTAYADVTGTGLAVNANTTYAFEFHIILDADATTTGIDVSCNGPAGATSLTYNILQAISTGGLSWRAANNYDYDTSATSSRGTSPSLFIVKGILVNGATAGTLIARAKREAVGSGPNARAGSYGILTKLS